MNTQSNELAQRIQAYLVNVMPEGGPLRFVVDEEFDALEFERAKQALLDAGVLTWNVHHGYWFRGERLKVPDRLSLQIGKIGVAEEVFASERLKELEWIAGQGYQVKPLPIESLTITFTGKDLRHILASLELYVSPQEIEEARKDEQAYQALLEQHVIRLLDMGMVQ